MTDYSKGLIYLIKHVDDFNNENCYFGSTTNFKARKSLHKSDCNNEKSKAYNTEKYKYIRANGGWINFIMLEIEKYPCNGKRQLTKREDDVMCEYKIRLNTNRACRSQKEYQKEYYENHKEEIIEQSKKYYENHKEEITEQKKEYYENHKEEYREQNKKYYENHKEEIAEKNKEYYENHTEEIKETHKKYYVNHKEEIAEQKKEYYENHKEEIAVYFKKYTENHKEEITEYFKKYYENHKEEIAEQKKEKITCECGCIISKNCITRHKKTVKHLHLICAKNNKV